MVFKKFKPEIFYNIFLKKIPVAHNYKIYFYGS